jgi:predicted nucleic acid-binding protein
MKYLLDVNALVALGFRRHSFHKRVATWVAGERSTKFASCSITELGFVRVLSQVSAYGLTVTHARELLLQMKAGSTPFLTFLQDDHDISHLPSWVEASKQTTDGHLAHLAAANGAILATFDRRVPGAFLIS